jgi:tetratricopeptide (TPR) repeat protein
MATGWQLDASRHSQAGKLTLFLAVFLIIASPSTPLAQTPLKDSERLAAAQKALDAREWKEAARLAAGPSDQSADFDFVEGLALAGLQRWPDAAKSFRAGQRKSPRDPRFLVELAGIAYKQSNLQDAKRDLQTALRLSPHDAYAIEFLGTIYFLEGNLESALKYWNSIDKPRLKNVATVPSLKLDQSLLNRAVTFNVPQVLTTGALLSTQARLQNLGIFPQQRFELIPSENETYDATLHLVERNGWGDSKLEGAISLLSGLPYATIYPELYNLDHKALNFTSLARWDSEKRRINLNFSTPLWDDPASRLRLFVDARNENWNLSQTYFAPGLPLADLNLRTVTTGAEFCHIESGIWSWSAGLDFSYRTFRNLNGHHSLIELPFFTNSSGLSGWLQAQRSLLRIPEHRFVINSSATVRAGRNFSSPLGAFATAQGALHATWFPQAKSDDYEMQAKLRTGDAFGKIPLDELFQLGIERDNDLWLRGHAGTIDGRKGAAPLGRRYFLANWEVDKNVYANGFLTIKLGPFLDNGAVADSSNLFGSRQWLWDTGAQCKIRVLGSVTVVLSYGRDLRSGKNVFYGTTLR